MNEKPILEPQEEEIKSSENEVEYSAPKDSAAASTVRVCDFCGKTFTSGKALGGHRRHHLQAQKKLEAQNNNQQPPSPPSNQYPLRFNQNNNVIGNGNLNNFHPPSGSFHCRVCDKCFPSEKSLYGHMRSHPEREWRGMNPRFTSYSSEEESDDEMMMEEDSSGFCSSSSSLVDSSLSLTGIRWGKKEKRGRGCIGAAEAAENFVLLCRVQYLRQLLSPTLPPPPQVEDDQNDVQQLPIKKRKKNGSSGGGDGDGDGDDVDNDGGDGDGDGDGGDVDVDVDDGDCDGDGGGDDGNGSLEGDNDDDDENHELQMTIMSIKMEVMKAKKNRNKEKSPEKMVKEKGDQVVIKTLKQKVVKSSPTPTQKYVCDICGESFNCCRALGGHKSKHNKASDKKGKEVMIEEQKPEVKGCINEEGGGGGASLIRSEERSVLSSNVNGDINMSNQEEEEVRKAGHQSGSSKMMDIDLNLPYALDD